MNVIWKCIFFDELSRGELYDILRIRQEVFVVEQTCYYLDADGRDQLSWHLMGYVDDKLHAYARLLPRGVSYDDYVSIGRVLISLGYRKSGLGKTLMAESIRRVKDFWPEASVKISAQSYLEGFYQHCGFKNTGDFYLEDGIPHQSMILHSEDC